MSRGPRSCSRSGDNVRRSLLAYRLLLFAFPAAIRREFGDDMAQMFARQIEDAQRTGRSRGLLWLRAVVDAAVGGAQERLRASVASEPPARSSDFGGVVSVRAARLRAMSAAGKRWRWWMQAFKQDIKYAFRVLAKQPGVTFVAILTLALGIGANSAIFSAVNAILLRPLPYKDPDRLVTLWEKRPAEGVMDNVVSHADFVDWTKLTTSFDGMAAMTWVTIDLTGAGDPVRLLAGAVSPSFF